MKIRTILRRSIPVLFVLLVLGTSGQAHASVTDSKTFFSTDQPFLERSKAADSHTTGVVNTGALNVRSGPSVDFGILTMIYKGQVVTLLARYYANNWVQIRLDGGLEGWVNSVYLNTSVPVSQLPVIGTPPTPVPPSSVTPSAVVNTGALNVRSGPGPVYPILTVVRQGGRLAVTGRNSAASWLKVTTTSNTKGWVNSSYVVTNVPINSLPIVESPDLAPAAVVVVSAANVRTGPGGQYESIAILFQGQSVRVNGRNNASSWLQVTLGNGQIGWISSSAVRTNVPGSSLPVVDVQPPTNSAVVNTGTLNVRYGPGVDFGVFTVLTRGQVVSMVGRASNSSWVEVRLPNGALGWVNSIYLSTSKPISELPVVYP